MEKKEPSPISVVWGWAEKYHSKFYGSVVLAVLGVAGTMAGVFQYCGDDTHSSGKWRFQPVPAMVRSSSEQLSGKVCGFCMVHVHVPYSNLLYSAGYP